MSVVNEHPPARTPGPTGDLRDLARRVPALKAMALDKIGDIANPTLSENTATETLTWSTASDWDAAAAENGVHHEQPANTDWSAADVIELGHPSAGLKSGLLVYHPFDEDSGSTAYDVSGNGNDGTRNGATVGVTGDHGTTKYSYDGTDDNVDDGANSNISGTITVAMRVVFDDLSVKYQIASGGYDGTNTAWEFVHDDAAAEITFGCYDGSGHRAKMNTSRVTTATEYTLIGTYTGSQWKIYLDGSDATDAQTSGQSTGAVTSSANRVWGSHYANGSFTNYAPVDIEDAQLYDNNFTATDASNWHAPYGSTGGFLETGTKSFTNTRKPDLQNLVYSLNSQSIDLKVIGSPGTASEEIVTQTLDGATSYTLTWSNAHTDFRLRPELSTASASATPTFSAGELVA